MPRLQLPAACFLGGCRLNPERVARVLRGLLVRSGLAPVCFHDLRHLSGTSWAPRVAVNVVNEMMGHSWVTRAERYRRATEEILRQSMVRASREGG